MSATQKFAIIAGIVLTPFVGWWAPSKLIHNGINQFAVGPEQAVARNAYGMTQLTLWDNPLARLFITGFRVVDVEDAPGSCPMNMDRAGVSKSQSHSYQADVRIYGPFAIPMGTYDVSCGGNYVQPKKSVRGM